MCAKWRGGLSAPGMARDYGINYWRPCLAATISVLNVFVWSIETSLCESRWTAQALSVIILFRFCEDKNEQLLAITGNYLQSLLQHLWSSEAFFIRPQSKSIVVRLQKEFSPFRQKQKFWNPWLYMFEQLWSEPETWHGWPGWLWLDPLWRFSNCKLSLWRLWRLLPQKADGEMEYFLQRWMETIFLYCFIHPNLNEEYIFSRIAKGNNAWPGTLQFSCISKMPKNRQVYAALFVAKSYVFSSTPKGAEFNF